MTLTQENSERALKRRIGFWGLLAVCLGLNIGQPLFALAGPAAALAGPGLPLAMLISSVPALLALAPYAVLASALPTTGGTYRYAQLANPTLALVCLLTLALSAAVGGLPLFALALGAYLKELVPVNPTLAGLMALTIFYGVNLSGIRPAVKLQVVLTLVLLSGLLLYIVLGAAQIEAGRLAGPFPQGPGGVLAASGLLFTFLAGGFLTVDLGGEAVGADKALPRTLFIGTAGSMVLYVLIMAAMVGLAEGKAPRGLTLIEAAESFMKPGAVSYFIFAGGMAACTTSINAVFAVVSRGLAAAAADGLLPAFKKRVGRGRGTPYFGLTLIYLLSVLALTANPWLKLSGHVFSLGLIFAVTIAAMAGLILPDRFPNLFFRSSKKISPALFKNLCRLVIIGNSLLLVFSSYLLGKATLLCLGAVLIFYGYALSRRKAARAIRYELYRSPDNWFEKILEQR